jgi:solute carrier family 35 protein E1
MASVGPSVGAVLATGSVWFGSSAVLSTWANTAFLLHFKDPILHTLIRFFGSAVFGYATYCLGDGITIDETAVLVSDVFWPAVLLWIANFSNSVALKAAGVTLTYVVKASIPVFTVIVCALQGQKFSGLIYVSLLPICLGVALASGSDLSFSYLGLGAALLSALSQTFMNLSIKKVRNKTGHSGSKAFFGMTVLCTMLTLPVVYVCHKLSEIGYTQFSPSSVDNVFTLYADQQSGNYWPLFLLVAGAVAYHVEYALNFVFVGFVSSVTFSVCDIARRIAIIVTGAIVFNKQLTQDNWVGICIALGGVLWYSYLDSKNAPVPAKTVSDSSTETPRETKTTPKKDTASTKTPVKKEILSSRKTAPKSPAAAKSTPSKKGSVKPETPSRKSSRLN